jgi:hypothetical protein
MENSHLQKYAAATAILADSYARLLVVSTTTPVVRLARDVVLAVPCGGKWPQVRYIGLTGVRYGI